MDDDLESCWQDLRPTYVRARDRTASKLKDLMEIALARSGEKLPEYFKEYRNRPITLEMLTEIVSKSVSLFLDEWYQELRGQNLAGLVEIILEGQDLTATEMGDFVRGLPHSLLERICKSVVKSATGIHGLMAIEFARRNRLVREYKIVQDGTRAYVDLVDLEGRQVSFYLDEIFELPEDFEHGTGTNP